MAGGQHRIVACVSLRNQPYPFTPSRHLRRPCARKLSFPKQGGQTARESPDCRIACSTALLQSVYPG
jgi:hypothetical protein